MLVTSSQKSKEEKTMKYWQKQPTVSGAVLSFAFDSQDSQEIPPRLPTGLGSDGVAIRFHAPVQIREASVIDIG
jgi:hypothetical protein